MKNIRLIKKTVWLVAVMLGGVMGTGNAQVSLYKDGVIQGTKGQYATIADALGTSNANVPFASGGTRTYVIELESNYTGEASYPLNLTNVTNSSATNTITIRPAVGAKVTIGVPNQTVIATVTGSTFTSSTTSVNLGSIITSGDINYLSGNVTASDINITTTSGSASATITSGTLTNGTYYVSGNANIPARTTFTYSGSTTITLSANATANATDVVSKATPTTNSYVSGISTYTGGSGFPFYNISGISGNTITVPSGTFTGNSSNGNKLYVGPAQTQAINFNGAKYITIDGVSRTGTTGLSIENPNCIYAQTIYFTGAAQYNTIQNCIIRGANQTGAWNSGYCGTVYMNGSHHNTITQNDICDIDNNNIPMPIGAVWFVGTGTNYENTLSYNNIYNVSNNYSPNGNTAFINFGSTYNSASYNNYVLNNKFYWTKDATFRATFYALSMGGSMNGIGNRFENNTIGWKGDGVTPANISIGTNSFYGSTVKNCTFKNNTIGGLNINGKTVIGFQLFNHNTSSPNADDICYGNTVKNIAVTTPATSAALYGILFSAVTNPFNTNIKNNIIDNLSITPSANNYTCTAYGIGYDGNSGTYPYVFSGNTISNIYAGSSTSTAVNIIYGVRPGSNASTIEKNLIFNLRVQSATNITSGIVRGIQLANGITAGTVIKNNVVRLGTDVSNDAEISCFYHSAGTTANTYNFYNNSFYIGGSFTNATKSSYIYYRTISNGSGVISLQNNIFNNVRGASTTANNQIYYLDKAADILASDHNLYQYNGLFAYSKTTPATTNYAALTNWTTTYTGLETGSVDQTDPLLAAPTAAIPDLHLTKGSAGATTNPADGVGVDLSASPSSVTDDYYGTTRTTATKQDLGAIGLDVDNFTTYTGIDNVWNSAGNWTNSIPASGKTAYVPTGKSVTVGINNGSCTDLLNAGTITIGASDALTIAGNLTNSADSTGLIIQSDATGTGQLKVTGSATGRVSFYRYMAGKKFHLLSAPVEGQSITRFLTNPANANISTGNDGTSTFRGLTNYNNSANAWNAYFTEATANNLLTGTGYLVRTKDAVGGTVKTTGTVRTTSLNLTDLPQDWNCVGNPFTTAIDIETLRTANSSLFTNLFGSIYVWEYLGDPLTGQYKPYTTGSIQAGQAFFVRLKNANTTFPITTAMQSVATGTPFRSATATDWTNVTLSASNQTDQYNTEVKFNDAMSKGIDSYDAGLFRANKDFSIYTRLLDGNTTDICLQALPTTMDAIPVGLDYTAGGNITFTASSFPEGYNVVLEDRATKTFTDLSSATASYTVNVPANTKGTGRFYLYANPAKISTGVTGGSKASNLVAYLSNGNLYIRGEVSSNAVATIYDVTGKAVKIAKLNAGSSNIIPFAAGAGIYVVNVDGQQLKIKN